MTQISRSLATDVAIQLTDKTGEEIEAIKNQLANLVETLVFFSLPADVKKLMKTHPGYLCTSDSYNIHLARRSWLTVYLTKQVPCIEGNNTLYVDRTNKAKLKALNKRLGLLQAQRRDLKKEIINTLLRLRSRAAIAKNFPEALAFIPEAKPKQPEKLQKSQTVEALRMKIKKQP